MKRRIFVLDDEEAMIEIAREILQEGPYIVESETSPLAGLEKIKQTTPDLVLLDISMDKMDGLEVCRQLKTDPKTKSIPIVFISVKAKETDVVVGLEMGADDYISKPVRESELLARIKAVLRRTKADEVINVSECGPFKVDHSAYKAWLDGKPLDLNPKQFELLSLFVNNEGKVLTRGTISEKIWGADISGTSRTLNSTVDQLRKNLGPYREWIKNLKGVGYRFEVEE